jgi:hypothetical protein
MNQLSIAEKHFPRAEQDIPADFFALRKAFVGTRWIFSEGRNPTTLPAIATSPGPAPSPPTPTPPPKTKSAAASDESHLSEFAICHHRTQGSGLPLLLRTTAEAHHSINPPIHQSIPALR